MSQDEKKTPPSPEAQAQELANEMGAIRGRLDGLVGELDHRRHDAFDVKRQLRQHWGVLLLLGATAVGVVAGAAVLRARRDRRVAAAALAKARGLRGALGRIFDHPERVAQPSPSVPRKIAAAGGGTLASVLARRLAQRLVR